MGGIGQQFSRSGAGGDRPSGAFDSSAFRSQESPGLLPEGPFGPKKKSKNSLPLILAGFSLLAIGMIVLVMMTRPTSKDTSDDRGAAVSHASGLQGHLATQWTGKTQYRLEIKPVDPQQRAQFAYAAANPPGPLYLNIRLLDRSGFAVCGKQVLFAFDPAKSAPPPIANPGRHVKKSVAERIAREQEAQKAELAKAQAQEQAREHGNDILQNEMGEDGSILAVNVQGTLPCSRDQYKQIDYWDFATNFPTVDEQDALMKHQSQAKALAERRAAQHRRVAKAASAFYIEGEERVTLYDAAREMLGTGDGKGFYIARKTEQATAASWAENSSLIQYKCDQHANCALKRAGTATVIYGRLNE